MEPNENKDLTDTQVIIAQNEEILSILRPLAGFVANDLPRLAEEAGPIINGLKNSPVLKMMGVSL